MARQDSQEITVPWVAPMPVITATAGTGADSLKVTVKVDNHGNGPVTIDWGDGTATVVNPGDGTTESTHVYTTPGEKTITATDQDRPDLTAEKKITLVAPPPPMELTVVEDTSDPTGMSVIATVDNKGQGPVDIDWGDTIGTDTNPGDGTTQTKYKYTNAGTYTVVATDPDTP